MVNQINKKRKNLTRELRAKRRAFKASSSRSSKALVHAANAKLLVACTTQHQNHSMEAALSENNQATKREMVVLPGKLGKNKSVIKPRLATKKKLRLLRRAEIYRQQRAHGSEGMDIEMIDSANEKGATNEIMEESATTIKEMSSGTTLGGPPL